MTRGYDAIRLRAGLREIRVERVFRVIHRAYRSTPLGATPARMGSELARVSRSNDIACRGDLHHVA